MFKKKKITIVRFKKCVGTLLDALSFWFFSGHFSDTERLPSPCAVRIQLTAAVTVENRMRTIVTQRRNTEETRTAPRCR